MQDYELTLILKSQLEEGARNELIERVNGWLVPEEGAEKPVVNHWGQRRLAYEINKNREGYYLLIETKLDGGRISDIEQNLRYNEDVLRYMFIRKEE